MKIDNETSSHICEFGVDRASAVVGSSSRDEFELRFRFETFVESARNSKNHAVVFLRAAVTNGATHAMWAGWGRSRAV